MGNRAERFRLGTWVVIPARGLIRSNGAERRLTPQQMEVLVCLARRPGEIVSKEKLLDEVWKAAIVEEGALPRCVSELRAALGDDARSPKYIQTVAGQGYRLITPPRRVEEADSAGTGSAAGFGRRRRIAALVATLLAALAGVLVLASRTELSRVGRNDSSTEPPVASGAGPVVAVLGFRNLSGDPESDWLSTAMGELLVNELAVSDELRVVPAQSVSRLTQELAIPEGETLAPETLSQIRSVLGADFVVQGSFLTIPGRPGTEVRLDTRIQDANTAEVVSTWTETTGYSHVLRALALAGLHLRERLGVQHAAGANSQASAYLPKDPTALRLYFRGIRALRYYEATAARDFLSRSLALEPHQPFALLALAHAWAALGYDAKAIEIAEGARSKSVNLPRETRLLVEAGLSAVCSRWGDAIERYRALCLLAPDNLDYAVLLARAQNSAGLPDDALATLARIGAVDKLEVDPRVHLTVAESAGRTGDHDRSLEAASRAAERAEILGSGLMLARARQAQAIALYGLGRVREASAALEEARRGFAAAGDFASEAGALGMEGDWLMSAGKSEEAQALLAEALKGFREVGDRKGEAETQSRIGEILAYRGDIDSSKKILYEAVSTFVELEDRFGQAEALSALAYALGSNGALLEAVPLLRESSQIFEAIGADEEAAATQSVLGMTLYVIARPREGHDVLVRAEQTFKRLGSRPQLGRVWGRMSSSLWCLGDLDGAEEKARLAFQIGLEVENLRLQGFALASLSRVLTQKGDFRGSEAAARRALELAEGLSMPTLDVAALVRLVEVLVAQGRVDEGVQYSQRAVRTAQASNKFLVGAHDVYVRALIASNEYEKARTVADRAADFDDGVSDTSMELALSKYRLQMQAAASVDLRDEIKEIEEVAKQQGHWFLYIDAKLARGELETYLTNMDAAELILREVMTETGRKGWVVLAMRAQEGLQRISSSAQ